MIDAKQVSGFTVVAKETSDALRKYDFSSLQAKGNTVSFGAGDKDTNEKAMKAYNNAGRKHAPWLKSNGDELPILGMSDRWIARLASNGTLYAVQVIQAPGSQEKTKAKHS